MLEYELGNKVMEYCRSNDVHYVPEYENWDLVAEYNQILFGVQLKRKVDFHGIRQCIECGGVDFKLLIYIDQPKRDDSKWQDIWRIARECKVLLIQYEESSGKFYPAGRVGWRWFRGNRYNLLPYRQHPNKHLILPHGQFDIPAGSRAPLNISDWKINMVRLEQLAVNGYVGKETIKSLGFRNVPRQYLDYDSRVKLWRFMRSPKIDFKYIYDGLMLDKK